MATHRRNAIINGTPYISDVGVNAFESLGNTQTLTVDASFDKKVVENFEGGGGNADVFYRFKEGTIKLKCRQVSIPMLLIALGGTAEAVAAGRVDETAEIVELDKLLVTDSMQDMAQSLMVKNSDGTVTYVEGQHYVRKRAGIVPISGVVDGIEAGDVVKLTFTKHAHQRVQALLNAIVEKGLLFDGINERTGAPWRGKFHRIGFSPSKSIEFIGSDFMNFDLEGEMLAWDGITDPAKSQFYELLVGDF